MYQAILLEYIRLLGNEAQILGIRGINKRISKIMENEKMTSLIKRGDFFLTPKTLPQANVMLDTQYENKSLDKTLRVDYLKDYLRFLELVVLNERIIVISNSPEKEAEIDKITEGRTKVYEFRRKGLLDIEDKFITELGNLGILSFGVVQFDGNTPKEIVDKYLRSSHKFKESFEDDIKELAKHERRKIASQKTYVSYIKNFGIPMALSESANRYGYPFLLNEDEVKTIKNIESVELEIRNGVISYLKDRLDSGAKEEIRQLNEIGIRTVFPETPISWKIVSESKSPEDFVNIALELRDEYKKFRKEMIELEIELFSDNVDLKRKKKLLKRINSFANDLWKDEETTLRKVALETTSLLEVIPLGGSSLSLENIPKLTEYLLEKPLEFLIKSIRDRKIRILIDAKKDFLKGKGWISQLASVFSISKNEIEKSVSSRS